MELIQKASFQSKSEPSTEISDEKLWFELKKGDPEALITIYYRYVRILYAYGMQITADRELVKDALQDIFLKLKQSSKGLGDVKNIKAYLLTMLRRDLLQKIKVNKKRAPFSLLNKSCSLLRIKPDIHFVNFQFEEFQRKKIEDALNNISIRQREAVLHHYYEGLSYQEISQIMALKNAKSARKLIYRALDSLRDLLGKTPPVSS